MHSQSYQSGYYPKRSSSQTSSTSTSSRSSQHSNEKKHSRHSSNPLTSKLFRTKSISSNPIEIPMTDLRQCSSSMSQPRDIPKSTPGYFDQHYRSNSSVDMSLESTPRSPKMEYTSKRASISTRKTSDDYRRLSGTINHCGRHSNDWLFGGFSVRETVANGLEKLRHNDKEG
ncbi:uncharacterized protein N7477_008288 [Penicillium maclennaniae]|uniref:uncharacterized protein n=1 Tax=Penicillium maclennaniae TaxID=1343394 RepID=UPI002542227E|nr:uncharacterized protein N7477_008288 [Penicillium maclennaniae]KAJ5665840.1 hypothetical protein N7477_008288 [Penicillium maclennaniae]